MSSENIIGLVPREKSYTEMGVAVRLSISSMTDYELGLRAAKVKQMLPSVRNNASPVATPYLDEIDAHLMVMFKF